MLLSSFHYIGVRSEEDSFDNHIVVIDEHLSVKSLRHIVLHSPTGMEWGYGGSGPADTALSILTDYFKRTRSMSERTAMKLAEDYHMRFKWSFIANAPKEGFAITSKQISDWIENLDPEYPIGLNIEEESKPLIERLREKGVSIMSPEKEKEFGERQKGKVSAMFLQKKK